MPINTEDKNSRRYAKKETPASSEASRKAKRTPRKTSAV